LSRALPHQANQTDGTGDADAEDVCTARSVGWQRVPPAQQWSNEPVGDANALDGSDADF